MDITPVYELKARLRAVTIAGTNLLGEDFRLKRAAEAMQPLEAASPVFARIGELVRRLLEPGTEGKEGLLLETITLVDALLCTQGEVAVTEELSPLSVDNTGRVINNAPYSEVKAIVDALTNSGGGRYSYLTEMHQRKPELFDDYRIKPAMVKALGASYAELADDVQGWLTQMGSSILPLLEKGFDPKGKKEMLRRVEIIEALAGAEANEFYLKQLPDSEKEIRQALIYALRHCPENEEQLSALIKTEKGKAKKMAYYAYACQDSDGARECFGKLAEKKPHEAIDALCVSGTEWASEMVQKIISELLDKLEKDTAAGVKPDIQEAVIQDLNRLGDYMEALKGKSVSAVRQCCRRIAALAERPQIMKLKLAAYLNQRGNVDHILKRQLARRVWEYLALCPDEEMISLVLELYQNYGNSKEGDAFFPAAMLAKLLSEEDCSQWLWKELERKQFAFQQLYDALSVLCWDAGRRTWVVTARIYSMALEKSIRVLHPSRQRVEGDFLQLLMGEKDGKTYKWAGRLDRVLGNCIPDGDSDYENQLMEYFYRRAKDGSEGIFYYCGQLKQYGFPRCEGIATEYFRNKKQISAWEISNILNALPGTDEAKRAEGQELLKLLKGDRKRLRDTSDTMIERLESMVLSL